MASPVGQLNESEGPRHPRRTTELIGHTSAEVILAKAARSGRLHHAWLFAGPKGIGKATLAHRFARFLLAGGEHGTAGDLAVPLNDPMTKISLEGAHPGLRTLEPEWDPKTKRLKGSITVDGVRGLHSFFGLTGSKNSWRITIVDSADQLNRNAANALLKMLEEPPSRALLLLVAHAPNSLMATIRSRCTKLRLLPLSPDELLTVLAQQEIVISTSETSLIARLSEGSPGRAIALAGGGGLDAYRGLFRLLQGMPKLDAKSLHSLADGAAKKGNEALFSLTGGLLEGLIARLIQFKATGGGEPGELPEEGELFGELAQRANLDQWIGLWEKVGELFRRTEAINLDRKQAVLIALTSVQKTVS